MTAPRPDKARQNEKTPPAATGDVDRRSMLNDDQSNTNTADQATSTVVEWSRVPREYRPSRWENLLVLALARPGLPEHAINANHYVKQGWATAYVVRRAIAGLKSDGILDRKRKLAGRGTPAYAVDRWNIDLDAPFARVPRDVVEDGALGMKPRAVLVALYQRGPLYRREIESFLDCGRNAAGRVISEIVNAGKAVRIGRRISVQFVPHAVDASASVAVQAAPISTAPISTAPKAAAPISSDTLRESLSIESPMQEESTPSTTQVARERATGVGLNEAVRRSLEEIRVADARSLIAQRVMQDRAGLAKMVEAHGAGIVCRAIASVLERSAREPGEIRSWRFFEDACRKLRGSGYQFGGYVSLVGGERLPVGPDGKLVVPRIAPGEEAPFAIAVDQGGPLTDAHPVTPAPRGVSDESASQVRAVARAPEQRIGLEAPCGSRPRRSRAGAGWRLGGW